MMLRKVAIVLLLTVATAGYIRSYALVIGQHHYWLALSDALFAFGIVIFTSHLIEESA